MTPLRTKTLCTEKSRFGCSDCVEGVLEVWGEGFYLGYLGLEGEGAVDDVGCAVGFEEGFVGWGWGWDDCFETR